MMPKYWIKSLSEWAPDEPYNSCPEIDKAIEHMEQVREINEELRKALKEAIEIIQRLDDLVLSLYEELNKKD
jgi:hypothetical protein